ncbi:choice-of-anchor K domain-containing protein [Brunnivagina elsteri]|uniref:PEP-CTERM sorting domain-containing protein n=1 Tax=Brunnivagina elsteri CCALA 953 TaxID=987040 RepID=A0A2A2TMA7_9CYAN|nr:choice-of-anchor K domain-containing protein [Calothrix elsteri]PAX59554.1 PEP-CTERM sorting domain-containing protein [Calothrix elsteri CCALA 953]
MKLSSVFGITLSAFAITAVAALGFSNQAKALIFSGDSSGTWGEPDPGTFNTNPIYKGVGTNTFEWGLSLPDIPRFRTPANSLIFKGTSFASDFNSLFKIGDLSYYNGTVPLYTNVEKVRFHLRLSFKNPAEIKEDFDFNFNLVNSPNDPNIPISDIANADYVFPTPVFTNRSFSYSGKQYTLELTGFIEDGSSTSAKEFRVREGAKTTAAIYGRINVVSPTEKVPEPGVVAGLSLLGFYVVIRKSYLKMKI